MTNKIITEIREKFIENIDAGLFLRDDINAIRLSDEEIIFFKNNFGKTTGNKEGREKIILSEKDEQLFNTKYKQEIFWDDQFKDNEMMIFNKSNPLSYLTAVFLKTRIGLCYQDCDSDFSRSFKTYWEIPANNLIALLKNAPKYIDAEIISENDLLYINVNEEPRVDIYIISKKYLIKLSLGSNGVIERIEHLIQKDIKRLNIINDNTLEIHFHGHHLPLTICLDDYKSVLQLQRHLTELRQIHKDNNIKSITDNPISRISNL